MSVYQAIKLTIDTGEEAVVFKNISDNFSGSENMNMSNALGLSDTGVGNDIQGIENSFQILETLFGNEFILLTLAKYLTDVLGGMETIQMSGGLQLLDTGTGADALFLSILKLISDVAYSTENLSTISIISLADTISGIEHIISLMANLNLLDTGLGLEILQLVNQFNLLDSIFGNEFLNLTIFIAKTIFDNAIGNELTNIIANFSVSDTANVSEILSEIVNQINILDTISGVEFLSLSSFTNKLLSDTAIGNEFLNAVNNLRLTENLATNEILEILSILSIMDNIFGIENILKQESIEGKLKVILQAQRRQTQLKKDKNVTLKKDDNIQFH